MPHHLGRGHRRGGIQLHRAPSFLGAGHVIILSVSLQENVRTLYMAFYIAFKTWNPYSTNTFILKWSTLENKGGKRNQTKIVEY